MSGLPFDHPGPDAGSAHRLRDTDRVEAFSDAVMAVAITLLVFDIRTPAYRPGNLLNSLAGQWPAYVAFLASFIYIGVIWINHHAVFNRISHVDRGLKWANLSILGTTALLPFPTAVIARVMQQGNRADGRIAVALYALVAAMMCAGWLLFYRQLQQRPHLVEDHVAPDFFPKERIRAIIGIAGYAAGAALGTVSPMLSLGLFLGIPLFYAMTSEGLAELGQSDAPPEDFEQAG